MYKSEINVQAYCQVQDDFIQALVDNLKKRFTEIDLDLLQWLGQLLESRHFTQADYKLRNYGSDELGVVIAITLETREIYKGLPRTPTGELSELPSNALMPGMNLI